MMCRGGIVVGGRADSFRPPALIGAASCVAARAWSGPLRAGVAIALVAACLAIITLRTPIPPLIESDYCYLLTAAQRWDAGLGPTTTPPVAPHQPWEWSADWSVLTKWPLGYPAILVALRRTFGLTILQACQAVACAACAAALVGWYLWLRRIAPRGLCGWLIAAVGAGSALSAGFLVNPSTDLILVAVLPFMLLLIRTRSASDGPRPRAGASSAEGSSEPGAQATGQDPALALGVRNGDADVSFRTRSASDGPIRAGSGSDPMCDGHGAMKPRNHEEPLHGLILAGLAAGGLVWIRYASVFVPVGIGLFLGIEWRRRRIAFRSFVLFCLAAALPIVALVLLNRTVGSSASLQAQLNLGESISPDFSWATLSTAWWVFADLGYYGHRVESHWLFAFLPILLVCVAAWARFRRNQPCLRHLGSSASDSPALKRRAAISSSLRDGPNSDTSCSYQHNGATTLSLCIVFAGLGMLVVGSTFFREKFDFVGLERYYLPLRPLYFALFVAPIALWSGRVIRALGCIGLLVAGSWTVQQDWRRDLDRWAAANRSMTPYGQWSRCFEPGAAELYGWLRSKNDPAVVVVSNFHEYIALETMIPALPIPADRETLDRWMNAIARTRNVPRVRTLFVLDPDNQWRDGWIASPDAIVKEFDLAPFDASDPIGRYVFESVVESAERLSLAH